MSAGNHEVDEVFTITHPSLFQPDGVNVKYAAEIKKHVKTPVATIGALSDPELMEEIIATGQADVVECGREFICEPDFPILWRTGRQAEAKRCLRCLSCFSSELTNGEPYCAINPLSGRELDSLYEAPLAKVKKKVLVAGGGIDGIRMMSVLGGFPALFVIVGAALSLAVMAVRGRHEAAPARS